MVCLFIIKVTIYKGRITSNKDSDTAFSRHLKGKNQFFDILN
jgi:hypothetical protein